MNWESIVVALIASLVSPTVLSWMTISARRKDLVDDRRRQDEVAARVDEAAKLVVIAKDELARSGTITNGKLDVIHKLVNSNMTAAMQDSLDSAVRERAALIELAEIAARRRQKPRQETLSAIALAEARIAELRATLDDRKAHTS